MRFTADNIQSLEEALKIILNNIPQAVFWKDLDSRYLGCNRYFAIDAGIGSPEEIVGKTDYDLQWATEQADFFRKTDQRIIQWNEPQYHIVQFQLQANGRYYWVDTNKFPLHDRDGNVIGILGIEEKLRLGEDYHPSTSDAFRVGTWEWNTLNGAFSVDHSLREVLRLAHKEDNFISIDEWFDCIHHEDVEQVESLMLEFLDGLSTSYEQKYRIRTDNASPRWVHMRGFTSYGQDGAASQISGTIADITPLHMAESRLQMRDVLLEATNFSSQYLLRTPNPYDAIPDVLTQIGRAIQFDRAYILENTHDPTTPPKASSHYVWTSPELVSNDKHAVNQLSVNFGMFQQWAEYLNSGQYVGGTILDFSPSEQHFFHEHDIISLLWLPIYSEGRWWGVLGFDSFTSERQCLDSEIDGLRGAAGAIGAALTQYHSRVSERRERAFAEALQDVATVLNSTLNLDEVLNRILDEMKHVVPHDAADILLVDQEIITGIRSHKAYDGVFPIGCKISEFPYLATMSTSKHPIMISNIDTESLWDQSLDSMCGYLGAPIVFENTISGFINLYSEKTGYYDESHASRLKAFVNQAAIAIRNANHYEQVQELAVLEERQRLARDLHDSVSQTLWTARMLSDVIPTVWEQNPESGFASMERLRFLTRAALAEMRVLLLELRPSTLTSASLGDLVRQLVDSTMNRTQLEITAEVHGNANIPEDVQIALYRITQEALNNLVKHSEATLGVIILDMVQDKLDLIIRDNGQGFDPTQKFPGHLGLKIMHERAESIGASLEILSNINIGTEVHIVWQES